MPRVIVSNLADADSTAILDDLERVAAAHVASNYTLQFEAVYDLLARAPESYQTRPRLGAHIHAAVVSPYLVIYRYVRGGDTVSIIRVLDGRRRITRRLVRGG